MGKIVYPSADVFLVWNGWRVASPWPNKSSRKWAVVRIRHQKDDEWAEDSSGRIRKFATPEAAAVLAYTLGSK